jgi:DNA helicase-2/ATP-dependent DNA helicase PcrA
MNRWQSAILLPVDQLILTLAQDLFDKPADLAVAHKLAVVLRQSREANRSWNLPEFNQELSIVARNERRFIGFSEDDSGFDPQSYRGKVVVATIHKAKGLEWDRVYLMSVNNYDFPSGAVSDRYISEPWYLRGQLNLPAEALEQLQVLFSNDPYAWYEEGRASEKSRVDYVSERLRLFYVGITRAKQELVITWNSGRNNSQQASLPFVAMQAFWEGRLSVTEEVPS